MRAKYYLMMVAASLFMSNCNQEETPSKSQTGTKTLVATIEGSSRSTVTDAGVFSWADNDEIAVLGEASNRDVYKYSGTGDGFNIEGSSNVQTPVVAYYPANESHTATEFYLPSEYGNESTSYVENTHAAMIATPPTEGNTYAFMHLGGVMRFNVKNVPEGTNEFIFTTDNKITGSFTVTNSEGVKIINTADGEGNTVSIKFKALVSAKDMTFYVPMPIGTYGNYTVAIKGENIDKSHSSTNVSNTIRRKTLLLMPTFIYDVSNGGQLLKGNAISEIVDLSEGTSTVDISNDAEVMVTPGDEPDATATLNYTPANDGSSTLVISDGSAENTPSSESEGKVVVATAGNSEVASCEINAPTLSVTLSAQDSGPVAFNEVTANTAQQTLIIGEGVTVEKLIINGGNVVIEDGAMVKTITNNVSGNTITAHVTSLEALNAAIGKGYNVILGANITSSDIIVINKPITLDGNGHTLTSTAGRAINVSGADGVTIKNLTIEASGERAINLIGNATNVTIDNVTATAANYAVNVANSAPAAKVVINNSILTGLNVVNVASEEANITIDNTKLICDDQNEGEGYAALALNNDAKNAKIIANNVTFVINGGSKQSSNGAYDEGGVITINGEVVPQKEVARITYPGPYYYSFETLQAAVTFAKSNDNIQLISDVTLTESLEIPEGKTVTLDLNGKTIYLNQGENVRPRTEIINRGTMTIKNGNVVSENKEGALRCIYNYGTMIIGQEDVANSGVTFTQTYELKGAAINNEGTMTIHYATVNAVFYSIWTSGSQAVTTVNGGTFTTKNDVNIRDTWAYAVSVSNGAKFVVNGGSFEGNHGVIAVLSGSTATLNKGTFHCTAGYTGNSDWTLYANGTGSIITYRNDCTITNANNSGIGATEEGGVIQEAN